MPAVTPGERIAVLENNHLNVMEGIKEIKDVIVGHISNEEKFQEEIRTMLMTYRREMSLDYVRKSDIRLAIKVIVAFCAVIASIWSVVQIVSPLIK